MPERGTGGRFKGSSDTGTPDQFANTTPASTAYPDVSFTMALIDVQKSLAALSVQFAGHGVKVDRLITDVHDLDSKVDAVRHQVTFVKGALWVMGAVITILALFLTWYFTGKLGITINPAK